MSIFQTSVIKKYENELDSTHVNQKYQEFQDYFGKPDIQEHIRNVNEEQFQVHFFRKLFVDILGYTLNDQPKYNLDIEFKNVNDSGKADGAILANGKAVGVIELKSTQTTDLDKVESQAFGYKYHHPGCVYIITSNFEKLRFYIYNAVDKRDFDLFNMTREDFILMWLCLARENLLQHVPRQMKDASVLQEEDITKKLYADYSSFREALFNNMVKNNPQTDKLVLFRKTQKLLDRFLFIFFAEDRLLVPPNSISKIIEKWQDDVAFGDDKSLYDLFKQYFNILNKGRPKSGKRQEIFAYNGGLFQPDELLDELIIDDDILKEHTLKLTAYDFDTDVDVNILGHIFEHSIGEIENVQAEIKGETADKNKSRRKKEGVYYTPKYITKYIVENTVGKLCEEKKQELGIVDEEYTRGRKNRKKTKVAELNKKLDTYRDWLLQLTILDPACGSGAFLNQALDFLIQEHSKVDELRAKLLEEGFKLSDITNDILENNIYGVDINEESVEIAKLSLWLRTAQKGRKLNVLSQNIKCGNSLIDDPEVAGEKAFKWEEEFPEVFKRGGFDVVIGNPPYGAELSQKHKNYLGKKFETFEYQVNTFVMFYEKGLKIAKNEGMLGYITPATFTYQYYFKKLREYLQRFTQFAISKYFYEVFEDADIGYSVSWIMKKTPNTKQSVWVKICKSIEDALDFPVLIEYSKLVNSKDSSYNLTDSRVDLNKFYVDTVPLGDIAKIIAGIKPYQKGKGEPKQTKNIVKEKVFTSLYKLDETYIQCVIGKDFHRYCFLQEPRMYLSYGKWLAEPRESAPFFDEEKIIIRQTSDSLIGTIDNKQRINLNNVYNIGKKDSSFNLKYLLGLINSKLLNFIYQNISQEKGRTFAEVKKTYIEKLPIKSCTNDSSYELESLVDRIMNLKQSFVSVYNNFLSFSRSNFSLEKSSDSLTKWYLLDGKDFFDEIEKLKKNKVPIAQKSEWMDYFNKQKQHIQELQAQIEKTERELDQMVYELYGLTNEEIKIVEDNVG